MAKSKNIFWIWILLGGLVVILGIGLAIWYFAIGPSQQTAAKFSLSTDKASYSQNDTIMLDWIVMAPQSPELNAVVATISWEANKGDIELTDVAGVTGFSEGSFDLSSANSTGTLKLGVVKNESNFVPQTSTSVAKFTFKAITSAKNVTINVSNAQAKNVDTKQVVDLNSTGVTFTLK